MFWLDRKLHKDTFQTLINCHNYITLNVHDETEIACIAKCFENSLRSSFYVGSAIIDSSLTNKKFNFLKSLVVDLERGDKTKFKNFYDFLNNLGKSNTISITQTMGTDLASVKSDIHNNKQEIHITDKVITQSLREENVDDVLANFIKDLKNFSEDISFLLIVKFLGKGYSDIGETFKLWFINSFLKEMKFEDKVKIVVLNHGKMDFDIKSKYHIDIKETIDRNGIYEVVEKCKKMAFPIKTDESTQLLANMLEAGADYESDGVIYRKVYLIFEGFCIKCGAGSKFQTFCNKCGDDSSSQTLCI